VTSSLDPLRRSSPGADDEFCLADNLAAGTATDATIPAVGAAFWYPVRGQNACGEGPYGFEGDHGVSAAPRVSTTCP
jgi:hypothetical protein